MEEEIEKLIEEALAKLREHCDAVLILTTWTGEDGNTERDFRGAGNWHAQSGMAHEFIEVEHGRATANELADVLPDQSEPPEEWEKND